MFWLYLIPKKLKSYFLSWKRKKGEHFLYFIDFSKFFLKTSLPCAKGKFLEVLLKKNLQKIPLLVPKENFSKFFLKRS